MAGNNDIVEAARGWVGTPFKHQGRVKNLGVDCIGLAIGVAKDLGIPLDTRKMRELGDGSYGRDPYNAKLEKALDVLLDKVPMNDLSLGDILLMRFRMDPQHLAIYGGKTIIHAYSNVGKVVEHRYADVWRARTVAAYRFRR